MYECMYRCILNKHIAQDRGLLEYSPQTTYHARSRYGCLHPL